MTDVAASQLASWLAAVPGGVWGSCPVAHLVAAADRKIAPSEWELVLRILARPAALLVVTTRTTQQVHALAENLAVSCSVDGDTASVGDPTDCFVLADALFHDMTRSRRPEPVDLSRVDGSERVLLQRRDTAPDGTALPGLTVTYIGRPGARVYAPEGPSGAILHPAEPVSRRALSVLCSSLPVGDPRDRPRGPLPPLEDHALDLSTPEVLALGTEAQQVPTVLLGEGEVPRSTPEFHAMIHDGQRRLLERGLMVAATGAGGVPRLDPFVDAMADVVVSPERVLTCDYAGRPRLRIVVRGRLAVEYHRPAEGLHRLIAAAPRVAALHLCEALGAASPAPEDGVPPVPTVPPEVYMRAPTVSLVAGSRGLHFLDGGAAGGRWRLVDGRSPQAGPSSYAWLPPSQIAAAVRAAVLGAP